MRILMTGATGFIGKKLALKLHEKSHPLTILTRDPVRAKKSFPFPVTAYAWNAERDPAPEAAFSEVDAVIHLAGESVAASRWSEAEKSKIVNSRVLGTRNLLATLNRLSAKPRVFISASAIGYYGSKGDEKLDEESAVGSGFLAEVCQRWESEGSFAKTERIVFVRIGVVLGENGGMLSKLLPLYKMGLGGPIGLGKRFLSWIHIDDLVAIFLRALEDSKLHGALNAVSPEPVRNSEFSEALSQALHRPNWIPAPTLALKIFFGQMGEETILSSQRVYPKRLFDAGLQFQYPHLNSALSEILKRS